MIIHTDYYSLPEYDLKEIARYMGGADRDSFAGLISECISVIPEKEYGICHTVFDIKRETDYIDLGFTRYRGESLEKYLSGCRKIILFAGTLGMDYDKISGVHSVSSPAKALIFQAIGAERVEALCDVFIRERKAELERSGLALKPRFSPGFGDFTLEYQKDIFNVLHPDKYIGLTLNGSMVMSPSKSVTAIVGLFEKDGCQK